MTGDLSLHASLSHLLLTAATFDDAVGLSDGCLIHEAGVLRVTGLHEVYLLLLVAWKVSIHQLH